MSTEQFRPLTAEEQEALERARELIAGSVPVFAARPALDADGNWDPQAGTGEKDGNRNGCGYWLPKSWEKTVPTENWLNPNAPGYEHKAWRPGWALGAVMGHGLDLLDVDPRNGGDATREALVQAGMWPRTYGAADTPSGGTHEFMASLDLGTRDDLRPGLDVKGGLPDGTGRGFAFIAPTVKASKTTGELIAYRWTTPLDLDALNDGDDDSGEGIAEMIRQARSSAAPSSSGANRGDPGDPFATVESRWPHTGPIPDGARYPQLRSYAGSLRRRDVHLDEAQHLMRLRWQDCAQPPNARWEMPWVDAEALLRDIYGRYEPAASDAERPGDAGSGPEGAESASEASWAPVDLASYLDGSYEPVEPTLLRRTDGVALLYAGLVHSFHGESESGKSLLLQIEAARLVSQGEMVLFVDFESDAASVADRLVSFGAAPSAVLKHFVYIRPQAGPDSSPGERTAWRALLERQFTLAVIDGVTDALTVFNFKTKENDDITAWMRRFPRQLAERTGAAVALVDHVTKSSEDRGRFAIGGQAKMNGLTGAAYTVDIGEALGRGMRGEIILRIAKDRVGQVRPHCGPMRKVDRTQEAARVVVDSTGNTPLVTVAPWRATSTAAPEGQTFRPSRLMELVSHAVERTDGLTKNQIHEAVGKNKRFTLQAIDLLVEEGFLRREPASNNRQLHHVVRTYRQVLDPLNPDNGAAGTTEASDPVVSGSGPYTGGPGTTTQAVPENHSEPLGTTTLSDPFSPPRQGPRCGGCGGPEVDPYGLGGSRLCSSCRTAQEAVQP
jgi:hypothetical protein